MPLAERVVQVCLYLFAVIAMLGGTLQMVRGQPQTEPRLDNVHRFMAGIYLGTGAISFWAAATIAQQGTLLYLIAGVGFAGGLGRLLSISKVGLPKPAGVWIGYLIPELIIPIVMVVCMYAAPWAMAPRPASVAQVADARTAIESQFSKMLDAYRRRDGVAFAAIYARDGEIHTPEMTAIGRKLIQADMVLGLAAVASIANDTAQTDDFLAGGNNALQMGHIDLTETSKANTTERNRITFAIAWRKETDGVWRIASDFDYETKIK